MQAYVFGIRKITAHELFEVETVFLSVPRHWLAVGCQCAMGMGWRNTDEPQSFQLFGLY